MVDANAVDARKAAQSKPFVALAHDRNSPTIGLPVAPGVEAENRAWSEGNDRLKSSRLAHRRSGQNTSAQHANPPESGLLRGRNVSPIAACYMAPLPREFGFCGHANQGLEMAILSRHDAKLRFLPAWPSWTF